MAAEVHAEPTGKEPGEQSGEQDYLLDEEEDEEVRRMKKIYRTLTSMP